MGDSLVKRSEKMCTVRCRSDDFRFACFGNVRHSKMAEGGIALTLRKICQKSTKDPKNISL